MPCGTRFRMTTSTKPTKSDSTIPWYNLHAAVPAEQPWHFGTPAAKMLFTTYHALLGPKTRSISCQSSPPKTARNSEFIEARVDPQYACHRFQRLFAPETTYPTYLKSLDIHLTNRSKQLSEMTCLLATLDSTSSAEDLPSYLDHWPEFAQCHPSTP